MSDFECAEQFRKSWVARRDLGKAQCRFAGVRQIAGDAVGKRKLVQHIGLVGLERERLPKKRNGLGDLSTLRGACAE